jgi:hypothetical protein
MKYLLYVMFSIVEYSSLFALMLALFRFQIRDHLKEILLASTLNAILVFTLNYFGLEPIAAIIQIVVAIVTIKYIFKEKLLKSLWITVCGYILFIITQTSFLVLVDYYKMFDIKNIDQYSMQTHILQMATVAINYLISFRIRKSNDGFAFSFHKKIFSSSRILFTTVSFTSVLTICILAYMFFRYKAVIYFSSVLIVGIISFLVIILLSYIQERRQFSRN